MFERVRNAVERVRQKWRKVTAWEQAEVEYDYKRVINQASGYVVHIRKCETQVNAVDGSERTRYEEVDTVWMNHNSWSVGGPVRWKGEYVYPDCDAMVFGNVARGYQR